MPTMPKAGIMLGTLGYITVSEVLTQSREWFWRWHRG